MPIPRNTPRRSIRWSRQLIALSLISVLAACGGGSDQTSPRSNTPNTGGNSSSGPDASTQPTAVDDSFQSASGSTNQPLDVLFNDTDPGNRLLTVAQIVSAPDQGGTATISSDSRSIEYTPANGFTGTETFTYNIQNSLGQPAAAPATVTITVTSNAVTIPPIPVADVFSLVSSNNPRELNVLANDIDPANSSPLTVLTVTSLANGDGMTEAGGTVTIGTDSNGNSVVNYTSPTDFVGPDSFQYTVQNNDGTASSTSGVVTIVSLPIAAPPVALPDVVTLVSNSTNNEINALANDVDLSGSGLSITNVASTVTVPPGAMSTVSVGTNMAGDDVILYTPEAGFVGVETLTYEITDGNGTTGTGIVTITVAPIAAPPVALPDVAVAMTDVAANIDPLLNDVDFSGGGFTIISAASSATVPMTAGGTVTISMDGQTINYTSGTGFIGVETITYTVEDGNGSTATSTIVVTVAGVPSAPPPIAAPDAVTVDQNSMDNDIDVLSNDIDPASGGLTIDSVTSMLRVPLAAPGTATVVNGMVRYTPAANFFGTETLNYVIEDSNGATSMGSIVIVVTPNALVLPPVALPDVATVDSNSSNNLIAALSNDVDAGMSGGLRITNVTSTVQAPMASASTITINMAEDRIDYTPPANFIGVETLTYTVTDDNGTTAQGTVLITVAPGLAGIPPVALPDVAVVNQDSAATLIDVLGNDIDTAMSGSLTLSVAGGATPGTTVPPGSPGTVSVSMGQLSYTPATGFAGVETIMYTVTDGNAATATGTLVVTVSPLPLPPIALPDVAVVNQDSSNNMINVLSNDVNVANAGSLTISGEASVATVPPGSTGTVSVNAGMLSYTPQAGFAGVETLQYTITDGNGNSAMSTVVVTVSPLALPPIAVPDLATVDQDSSNNLISVVANDADAGMSGGLTVTVASMMPGTTLPPGSPGTVTVNGSNQLVYTPAAGFAGAETIMYTLTDDNGGTATGTVAITVTPAPVNIPPIGFPDVFAVNVGDPEIVIDVLANDVDTNAIIITSLSTPVKALPTGTAGTLVLDPDNVTLRYTPGSNALTDGGLVTFTYVPQDADGATGALTLVTITVTP